MAEISEIGREEEEVELDLGLAIGRSFRKQGRPALMAEESGFCESPMNDAGAGISERKEIHALRREGKRKWVETLKNREVGGENNQQRRNKKEKIEKTMDSLLPFDLSPIIPMQFSDSLVKYLPIANINGYVFPCVMPCWRPLSGGGNFKPCPANHIFNQSIGCKVVNGDKKKTSDGSPAFSSPVVAANQSCSNKGGGGSRSDGRSHSNQSLTDLESNGSSGNDSMNDYTASSRRRDNQSVTESSGKVAVSGDRKVVESNRIIKNGKSRTALPSMPCVSTIGNRPDSKRIMGFLYKYSKSEVSIVCVCHGKRFTAAEFVKHAGGTEVSNPLRHITVIPSGFG